MSQDEPKIVRYDRKPLTAEQIARLDAVADVPDDQIDFSDIPEAPASFFENAAQGMMYRALKQQTTLRLDVDVLEWFKRHAENGRGYQTDINRALREYIAAKEKKTG
jgi:uncharacterized protein (DUF4415 family)